MAGQSKRGFAAMGPQKQREIARRGGQTAHQKGTAHEFTPDEARIAGRRGGRAVSKNRQYMAEIGRRGGQSSGRQGAKVRQTQNTNGNGSNGNTEIHGMTWGRRQGATDLLRADHRKVEELFAHYETVGDQSSQKAALVKEICQELEVHTRIEEEIFYPAVQALPDEDGGRLVAEAVKEHGTVKDLIGRLRGMAPGDAWCHDTVRQLKECVTHHVEEEEKEMLPKAEKLLGDQLELLGTQMRQRKQHLMRPPQDSAQAEMPA